MAFARIWRVHLEPVHSYEHIIPRFSKVANKQLSNSAEKYEHLYLKRMLVKKRVGDI